jgi:hypothetical protein
MSNRHTIKLSLLLTLPVFAFVLQHYFIHPANLHPTGFTTEENVLYTSYAEQYLDQNHFTLAYSNPFDGEPTSPDIYFQPFTFLFAGLIKLGLDPGLCFSLFGLIMTFLCIYLGVKILRVLLPEKSNSSLLATLFTWGGGLLALAGLMSSSFLSGHHVSPWIEGIYIADPSRGWWGLNWGRTLFLPLEAYYHFLFLLNIYLIIQHKWIGALVTSLFLSISHPFTGIEFLLIINGWLILEKLVYKNSKVPWWFCIAQLLVAVLHVGYYLIYLNSFPEHRLLFNQYSNGWSYSLWIAIPAYCLVATFSFLQLYFNKPTKKWFAESHQRLFFCWALISFLLSKHEWFIKPMQPIHFTRGYTWAGLFLFGLPALVRVINYLQKKNKRWLLYVLIIIFLSDNILWTANLLQGKNNVEWEGHITKETREVLHFLHDHSTPNDLLMGNGTLVKYLANTYSSANSWVSHPYNTPMRQQRIVQENNFLLAGVRLPEWENRRILVIMDKRIASPYMAPSLQNNKLFENDSYIIFTP